MKSIIKYIIGGMGLLSITSCSDFLDQSSPSEIKGDMVFNSLTFTEQSLNKVYAGLTLDHTYGARIPLNFGFNTDIELVDADVNKPASFTESSERALGNYNGESISGSWSKLDDNWKNCFAIIEDANLVVEGIRSSELFQEGNPARNKMANFLGEALTIRAMVYFDLVKNYGDLPMKFETTKVDGSNLYVTKSDRDDIMEQLLSDLEETISLGQANPAIRPNMPLQVLLTACSPASPLPKPATVSANPPNPAMRHLPALTVHTLPNAQEKQKENCCMNVH